MSKLILPKATAAQREAATPVAGEIFYDKDKKAVFFGDDATRGGVPLMTLAASTAFVYGIDIDLAESSPATACKRVILNHANDTGGNASRYTVVNSFSQLPAHHFRRCVMSDLANRTVAYYLGQSDSRKRENGAAADLTGIDGDVMVEIPVTYYRIDTYTYTGHAHRVYLVSDRPFTGSAPHPFFYTSAGGATLQAQYVGAFRDVLCNADGTPKNGAYAAGDKFRSIAGHVPCDYATRNQYRVGSSANGGALVGVLFRSYLTLMMIVEAGTTDIQSAISPGFTQLDPATADRHNALRKTGRTAVLGNGTGDILAATAPTAVIIDGDQYDWISASSTSSAWKHGTTVVYTALTPSANGTYYSDAGLTTSAGTISGVVVPDADLADHWADGVTRKVVQFSYRGIEDPFGSAWEFVDGFQAARTGFEAGSADGVAGYWFTNDVTRYAASDASLGTRESGAFPASGCSGANLVYVSLSFPVTDSDSDPSNDGVAHGYIVSYDPLTFFPLSVTSGSSSTYLCDFFNDFLVNGMRIGIFGGTSTNGGGAGPGCMWLFPPIDAETVLALHVAGRIASL